MKRYGCYVLINRTLPKKEYCCDGCEDCKYFLTGNETMTMTLKIKNIPVLSDINQMKTEIEEALDYVGIKPKDIDFIEERID